MLDLSFVDGSTRGKMKGTTSARTPIGPVPSVLLEDRRSVHGRVSWKQIWARITSGVLYGGGWSCMDDCSAWTSLHEA